MMYGYNDFLSQLAKVLCLSDIVTEAPFLSSLKDSPLLLCYFACDAQDTWQSYQTELKIAESIGETRLPFVSSLLYQDCNSEGPGFICPLTAHSLLLPNRPIFNLKK